MTGHRIFIAINLPQNIKKELSRYQDKWPEMPCRWTKADNLHITLEFLGSVSDEELLKVFQETEEMALKYEPFSITLNKICYGPPKKMPPQSMSSSSSFQRSSHSSMEGGTPRMIWVIAAPQNGASLALFGWGEKIHITLGRIKAWEFRKIEPEERPPVDEDINLTFEVNSIEVMESVLKRGGPAYTILKTCPLTPLEICHSQIC